MMRKKSRATKFRGYFIFSNKHGRRTKFKWPDTFLIESSGRRESPESTAEMREALKRHNFTIPKHSASSSPDEDTDTDNNDSDLEVNAEISRLRLENDAGSDQDLSDDEEFEDLIGDVNSES